MTTDNLAVLETFDEQSLPDLDVVTLAALERFATTALPSLPEKDPPNTLVLGSVNAARTAMVLFRGTHYTHADESQYQTLLGSAESFVRAYIISASGGKHAIDMARQLRARAVEAFLLTNNPQPPARDHLDADHIQVFPKNREPYTYNTSTYLGMILARTQESAEAIHAHLVRVIAPALPSDLETYDAFTLLIPSRFWPLKAMLQTKFDELFGPMVNGRIFTDEEIKHAKTVVPSNTECFLALGVENKRYGAPKNRFSLPLPADGQEGMLLAAGYYAIGHIQKAKPPYFKEHIAEYAADASTIFGHKISVIVE